MSNINIEKPKITDGEWSFRKVDVSDDGANFRIRIEAGEESHIEGRRAHHIANISFFREEVEANAKAISAVPDMIDALIGMREYLQHLRKREKDRLEKRVIGYRISNIEQKLKKAGCTIKEES